LFFQRHREYHHERIYWETTNVKTKTDKCFQQYVDVGERNSMTVWRENLSKTNRNREIALRSWKKIRKQLPTSGAHCIGNKELLHEME